MMSCVMLATSSFTSCIVCSRSISVFRFSTSVSPSTLISEMVQ